MLPDDASCDQVHAISIYLIGVRSEKDFPHCRRRPRRQRHRRGHPHRPASRSRDQDHGRQAAAGVLRAPEGKAAIGQQPHDFGNDFALSMKATAPETVEVGDEFEYVIDPGAIVVPKSMTISRQNLVFSNLSQTNLWIDLPKNVELVSFDYDKNTPLKFNVLQDGNRLRFVGENRREKADTVGPVGFTGKPVGDNPAEWKPGGFFGSNEKRWFYGGAEITKPGDTKLGKLPKVTLKLKATGEPGSVAQATIRKTNAKNSEPEAFVQGLIRVLINGNQKSAINALTRCGLSQDYTGTGAKKAPATPFPAVTIVEKPEPTPEPEPTKEPEPSTSEETTPPSTTEPTKEEPTKEEPTKEEPTSEKTSTEETTTEEAPTEPTSTTEPEPTKEPEPSTSEETTPPSTTEPTKEEPTKEEPTKEEPTKEEPTSEETSTEETSTEETSTEEAPTEPTPTTETEPTPDQEPEPSNSSEGSAQGELSSNPVFKGLLIAFSVFLGLIGLVGVGNWLKDNGYIKLPF